MKETVQQRDLYSSHYVGVFIQDTRKNVVARDSPRQTGSLPHAQPHAVSRCSQCIITTPFLETT
jgi:hypothetical protein